MGLSLRNQALNYHKTMHDKSFWDSLPRPIIALSPMEGWTDSAMRRISKEVNPDIITFTEFTSVDGLVHAPEKVKKRLFFDPSEMPIIAQIYGKNLDSFVNAARLCEEMGFAGIDINMGCPAKKVVKSEQGIALRKNHDLAFRMVETVAKTTKLAVSVKTRLGWNDASDLIIFGKGVESAGANLITIHARTYQVPYGCEPEYEPVYELKKEVSIPVLGNGGITSLEVGMNYLGNLDGFMIGQAAMGNPWVFSNENEKTFEQKLPTIIKHVEMLHDVLDEKVATLNARKHLFNYIKGFRGAAELRKEIIQTTTKQELISVLKKI